MGKGLEGVLIIVGKVYIDLTLILIGEHLILSLDSSSTMALVQLEVLNQLEKTTGKKITDIFEWIVASGVGGFLMMAMVYG